MSGEHFARGPYMGELRDETGLHHNDNALYEVWGVNAVDAAQETEGGAAAATKIPKPPLTQTP